MNWLENLIYGLVSGFAEFLPISSSAHQQILLELFGINTADPLQNLMIHLASLFALFVGSRGLIDQLRREQNILKRNHRGVRVTRSAFELRLLKNAVFPMWIGFFIFTYFFKIGSSLAWSAFFSVINGIILFSQGRMMQGNRDEQTMSVLDSILIGVSGAFSAFPGISRISAMLTATTARGVDKQKAANWVILLSIPGVILISGVDILNMIANPGYINFPSNIFGYILSAIGAYFSGYFSVLLMKSIAVRKDYSGFAYYSWGIALFSFILYLTVV